MSTSSEMLQNEQVARDNSEVKKINKLLNSSETRTEGLELLNSFLSQCSVEDFLQFCISWMQSCCKIDALAKNRDCAIYLLSNLIKISSNYQELKKSVSFFITTRYFDYFFKYLLNSQAGWHCTESCLMFYRGACGPFQVTLEKHLKAEIEKNIKISEVVGGCFALLPCIGGGGNEGANYMKNWKIQFVNFLNACHFILNELFVNVEGFQEHETVEHTCNDNKKERSMEHLSIKLKNDLIILNCMLLNQYPVPKNVPTDLIFQLICRGLALNPKALVCQKTASVIFIEKVLPEIQCTLLSLLKALIVTCKNQLLPYSHLICKLIKQILEWTECDFTRENERPFERLRVLVYETLCDWLTVARSGSCIEVVSTVVISNAVNDIKSKKKFVFLKETRFQSRLKGKEQKKRRIDAAANGKLCHAALKALQYLLKFAGVLLRPEEQKFLQEIVVKIVAEVQKNSSSDVPVSFGVPECRAELYSVLLELICQPCPKWPPPTNYALRLFSEGMNDPSSRVSSVCSAALNLATIIIHPQYDNGAFPPWEELDDRSKTELAVRWRNGEELMETENGNEGGISRGKNTGVGDKFFESDKRDKPEKLKDLSDGSNISSDEDSRNTVNFLQDSVEPVQRNPSVDETKIDELSAEIHQPNDGPQNKKQKIFVEECTSKKIPSPVKEKLTEGDSAKGVPENDKMKKPAESTNSEDLISSKSVSPDSINEEDHPKARYYLRSKTKGSSEEPEEAGKRTSSPEASKSTPTRSLAKSTLDSQSAKKRPRTRALSKAETNNETEAKTLEKSRREEDDGDEEDIKAAFDDSFVD